MPTIVIIVVNTKTRYLARTLRVLARRLARQRRRGLRCIVDWVEDADSESIPANEEIEDDEFVDDDSKSE